MNYSNTVKGIFVSRPNRFVAQVKIPKSNATSVSFSDSQDNLNQDDLYIEETVHVKNTGRCEELLIEGVPVILVPASNPERKTKYDLIAVYRDGYGWINIDSQAPNQVMKEWLENPENEFFKNISFLKPEFKFKGSRIDFYLEKPKTKELPDEKKANVYNSVANGGLKVIWLDNSKDEQVEEEEEITEKVLIEVKGVTLIKYGVALFPDAPTDRGVKHLEELAEAAEEGYSCYIAFVIPVNTYEYAFPNTEMQPEFDQALKNAIRAGVHVLYLATEVTEDKLVIKGCKEKKFI